MLIVFHFYNKIPKSLSEDNIAYKTTC